MGVYPTYQIETLEDHPQVSSPEDCQTSSDGMDPVMQKGSFRRNPEVEGPFVHRRPSPGVRGHLLDSIRPCCLIDNHPVCFYHGTVVGMAHEVYRLCHGLHPT